MHLNFSADRLLKRGKTRLRPAEPIVMPNRAGPSSPLDLNQLLPDFSTDLNQYNRAIASFTNREGRFWEVESESTIEYDCHFHVASLPEAQTSSQMGGSDQFYYRIIVVGSMYQRHCALNAVVYDGGETLHFSKGSLSTLEPFDGNRRKGF